VKIDLERLNDRESSPGAAEFQIQDHDVHLPVVKGRKRIGHRVFEFAGWKRPAKAHGKIYSLYNLEKSMSWRSLGDFRGVSGASGRT
jgi:hypothetical protein